MKRYTHYILLVICIFTTLLASCVDNGDMVSFEEKILHVANYDNWQSLKNVAAIPDKAEVIKVKATNVAWKFTELTANWITLSPMSGRGDADVQVIVAENTDPTTARTATWKFSSEEPGMDYNCSMSLSQEAAGYFIRTEKTLVEVAAPATTCSIKVSANCEWSATSNQSWVTCNTTQNSLTLTINENTTTIDKDREAKISLNRGSVTEAIVEVRQNPANITAKTDELVFQNTGGIYKLDVTSEVSWTASTSSTWFEVSPSSALAGKTTLSITALPNNSANERTANVYIKVGTNQKYKIPVRLLKSYVTANKSSLKFGFQSSSQNITISSNTAWQIISKPDFVTVTLTDKQQGNNDIQINVSANEGSQREGDVVIGVPNVSGLQQKIHIIQEGPYMQPDVFTIDLGSTKGSKHKITLNTNDSWTAYMQYATWATVSPTSGTGTAEVTITVDDNPTLNERTNKMLVTCANAKDIEVTVVQKGRYLNVDKSELWFFTSAGEEILTIDTDASYEVKSTVNWATVSRSGNIITVKVSELSNGNQRDGAVVITMTGLSQGEKTITIPIYQRKGANFNVVNFTDDECWDLDKGLLNFSVDGFGADTDWNMK